MNKLIGSNPERDFRSAISTDLPYLPEKDSSRRGSDVVFNPRLAREFVKVQTTKKRVSIKSVKKKIVNIQGNFTIPFLVSDCPVWPRTVHFSSFGIVLFGPDYLTDDNSNGSDSMKLAKNRGKR